MDAKRCDRCKKFYLPSDNIDKRPSYAGNRMFNIRTLDLDWMGLQTFDICADCANAFMSWTKMGESNKSLCDSCITKECMFQSGIVRRHCDFYTEQTESEE